tara:strand:- start:11 stop:274 length:264 start_codon:yes stop_codon:yes gene_type:complete
MQFIDEDGNMPDCKSDVKIIIESRGLNDNEFVFQNRYVITDDSIRLIFTYISEISNVKITYNDRSDTIGMREGLGLGAPILLKVEKK